MSTCINNVINLHYRCSDNFLYKIRFTILSKELYNFLFSSTLYPSSRSSQCISFFVNIIINFKQPVQNTGKNIKSYATTQVHFPREREGSLTAKVQIFHLNMVRLNRTYYSLLKFTSKIFKIVSPSQIPANYANSVQFALTVREFRKIRTFC